MSVQRFKVEDLNCCFQADMVESEDGDYVLHSDYAALAVDNERLSLSVRHYVEQEALRNAGEVIHRQRVESGAYNREKNEIIKNLLAENERLRKAVEASLEHFESGFTSEYRVVEACKAALHGGSTNPPDQA